jgi:hypothetical protein
MPRDLPYTLISLLKTGRVESHTTLHLKLIDAMSLPRTYYLATAAITYAGVEYDPRLKKVGARTQSLTRATDKMLIEIENVSLSLGPEFIQKFDELYGAEARICRYFRDLDTGQDYLQQVMSGVVRGTGESDENTVNLTVISDTYAKSVGGGRKVARKCQFRYRGPKCLYAGVLATCNKLFDSINGCTGHTNTHHYGGFSYKPSSAIAGGASGRSLPALNQIIKTT